MNERYEVIYYIEDGKNIFRKWMDGLRDYRGKAAIDRAIGRVKEGNFGEHHFCRDGVWELIIDYGPGYRVYYSVVGNKLVLLLCGGSKRTQDRDIDRAVTYLRRFKEASPL